MGKMGRASVVSKWMLEFAVDEIKDDRLIAKTLSVGSVGEADCGLKKSLLLRAIESEVSEFSVSEKMLDLFEIVLHMDKEEGVCVLESMKEAYCMVAIDCVARYVKRIGDEDRYLDAVKRVWRKRITRLFANNVDLVSDQLETWGDVIESGIWDDKVREHLFDTNTRLKALLAVKKYLDEAWKTVRPKFLDVVSGALGSSLVESQKLLLQRISKPNEGDALKSLNIPQEMGEGNNTASQCGGDLKVSCGPSNLFPTTLLNNKDHEDVANTFSQNLGCNFRHPTDDKHNGSIPTTGANIMSLHQDGDARLAVSGIPKERDQLQTSAGLIQDQSENVEPAHAKGTNTVEEQEVDVASSAAHGNLQSPNHSNAHYKDTSKVKARRKHVGGPIKRFKRARIDDSEDVDPERSDKQHDPLPESNVIKVHEQLKYSARELQHVVKDPLPEALHAAEEVLADSSRNFVPQSHPTALHKVEVGRGKDEASTSCVNEIRVSSMEGNAMNLNTNQDDERHPRDVANTASPSEAVCVGEKKIQNVDSGHNNHQRKANLWERGTNACVYEWDDSVDGSPKDQHGLPTPKAYVNSPLKKYENRNFARRRQIKRWSVLEEDTLRAGVQRFGKGNWTFILNAYREIFQERTAVDLKDKWRCMIS